MYTDNYDNLYAHVGLLTNEPGFFPLVQWSVIEINIGILAASIPSYKTIAKRYAPKLLGSSSGGNVSRSKSKLSGFHQLTGRGRNETPMDLRNLDSVGTNGSKKPKPEVDTQIEPGSKTSDNSSEEALFTPKGQISVKTQIFTRYDG